MSCPSCLAGLWHSCRHCLVCASRHEGPVLAVSSLRLLALLMSRVCGGHCHFKMGVLMLCCESGSCVLPSLLLWLIFGKLHISSSWWFRFQPPFGLSFRTHMSHPGRFSVVLSCRASHPTRVREDILGCIVRIQVGEEGSSTGARESVVRRAVNPCSWGVRH